MAEHSTADDDARTRADLLPEEERAGSDDPAAQAETILQESDERTEARDAEDEDGEGWEHRTSDETTPPAP